MVEKLSHDLKMRFSGLKFGFSPRSLWQMRRSYLEYRDNVKLQQLVAEIPWGQNLLILERIKDDQEKLYCLTQAKEHGWVRDILTC